MIDLVEGFDNKDSELLSKPQHMLPFNNIKRLATIPAE